MTENATKNTKNKDTTKDFSSRTRTWVKDKDLTSKDQNQDFKFVLKDQDKDNNSAWLLCRRRH